MIPLRSGLIAAIIILAASVGPVTAQTTPPPPLPPQAIPAQPKPDDPERQHAYEQYTAGKMVDAMPLFEKLCSEHPQDNALWEAWGVTILHYSQTLTSPDQRKAARVRARTLLVKAKELGDNSNLLQVLLGMIPEDGGEGTYSPRKEVNDAMQRAESDFARGDYDKAREGYLQALLLEPANYEAALFIGDVYYKQHINGSAGEWFARAIEIDPNRETAYRYWGDALWAMGKSVEARDKFIQAIVADPYNNRASVGLNQWAQRTKVSLTWVRLQDKSKVEQKDDQHTNITIDAESLKKKNDPSGAAWLAYAMNRALWQGEKFKKEFPGEPKYRRTMREEADSLHMMVAVMTEQKDFQKRKRDLDPSLLQLIQVDQAGFLEPFVLFNRSDSEIAQDYPAYRAAHRDTLYRYFDEFVVPKASEGAAK